MSSRTQQGSYNQGKILPPLNNEICLGKGSRAKKRYDSLTHMLGDAIRMYRQSLDFDSAHVLESYMRGPRWKKASENNWTLDLYPDEWQALSFGLRALAGTPANSMYQYLALKKITEYDHGD